MTSADGRSGVGSANRILGAVVNYGLGSYVPQIVGFVLLPFYSHRISPREFGELELAMAAQALFIVVTRAGLPGALSRLYFDATDPSARAALVKTLSAASMVVSLAGAALVLGVGPAVTRWAAPDFAFWTWTPVALVAAVANGPIELQRRLLQVQERSREAGLLTAAFAITTTVLSAVAVLVLALGGFGLLLASAVSSLVFATVAIVRHRRELQAPMNLSVLRPAFRYGLPLLPHHASAWAHQSVGRFFLGGTVDAAAVGQLALATRIASPISVATGAFSNAFSPIYFGWRKTLTPEEAVTRAHDVGAVVTVLGTVAVVGASCWGGWFARHALSSQYSGVGDAVGPVAFALWLHLIYTFLSSEPFFQGTTGSISIIFPLSSAVTIAGTLLLGVRFGAVGAAIAQCLGGVISVAAGAVLARRTLPGIFPLRALVSGTVVGLAACVGTAALHIERSAALELLAMTGLLIVLAALAVVASGTAEGLSTYVRAIVNRVARRRASR